MYPQQTILELANAIVKDAAALNEHIQSQGLPQPSFDQNGPSRLQFKDREMAAAQERILSSTKALHHLTTGPATAVRLSINNSQNAAALAVIHGFDIAQHVPVNGAISYEDLAHAVGIPRSDLKTILRLSMTDFVFHEPTPGFVAHTAASRLLKEDPLMRAWVGIGVEELVPASSKVAEAMLKHPGSEEPLLSGWSIANSAQLPLFAELSARHPRRAATFARAMEFMATMVAPNTASLAYDWRELGDGTVVDVGGGKGPVAIELARAFPDLRLIVQDLEEVCESGREQLPSDLRDRVTFMRHDFFTPQPVAGADVYYFRAVFHNWPDKYCMRIVENLIPALKPGARIVIQDPMFPESGRYSAFQEEQAVASDLMMMTYFNAHNREAHEWPQLFARVDSRFSVKHITAHGENYPLERMGTFVVVWQG